MNIANPSANTQHAIASNREQSARKREIAATYAADKRDKRQSRRKPPLAWIRASELERLFHFRYGATLPDDDAGRDDLWLLVQHLANGPDAGRRCQKSIRTWAAWMPEDEAAALIAKAIDKPFRFKAATVAKLVRLTDEERFRLGITTIRSIDARETPAERKNRQRREKRAKARALKPPSLSQTKPWEAEGISRKTWYRRRDTKHGPSILGVYYAGTAFCVTAAVPTANAVGREVAPLGFFANSHGAFKPKKPKGRASGRATARNDKPISFKMFSVTALKHALATR
jgi:hypothetical protein